MPPFAVTEAYDSMRMRKATTITVVRVITLSFRLLADRFATGHPMLLFVVINSLSYLLVILFILFLGKVIFDSAKINELIPKLKFVV
jgi:hypothetical protein